MKNILITCLMFLSISVYSQERTVYSMKKDSINPKEIINSEPVKDKQFRTVSIYKNQIIVDTSNKEAIKPEEIKENNLKRK